MVFDQSCAAEARRLRKRGVVATPTARVAINDRVCEGCGDCNTQSNCVAVEPYETVRGRKRRINQDGCNIDTSCLKGYCPSFVTVENAVLRKPVGNAAAVDRLGADLPEPTTPVSDSVAAAVHLAGTVAASVTLPAINPQPGQPTSKTITTTRYAGDSALGLLAFQADPTQCAGSGVSSAGISGTVGLGSQN